MEKFTLCVSKCDTYTMPIAKKSANSKDVAGKGKGKGGGGSGLLNDGLLLDYQKYQKELEAKLGHTKCLVLYQNGSFSELLTQDEDFMKRLCGMLNIAYSKRSNAAPSSTANPYMAGWPSCSNQKYIDFLLDAGIAVGLVTQIDRYNNGSMRRAMTEILTPELNVDTYESKTDQYHTLVFVEPTVSKRSGLTLYAGISKVDLSTGVNVVSEAAYKSYDELKNVVQELSQVSNKLQVMTHGEDSGDLLRPHVDELKVISFCMNQAYLELSLSKVFNASNISMLERLNLSRCPLASKALVLNLNSIYGINPRLLNGINEPVYDQGETKVLINPSLLDDIHVLPKKNAISKSDELFAQVETKVRGAVESLLEIYDKCVTNTGSRALRNKLLNPTYHAEALEESYLSIEEMQGSYEKVREALSKLQDPVRNLRKLQIHSNKINVTHMRSVIDACRIAKELVALLEDSDSFVLEGDVDSLLTMLEGAVNEDAGADCWLKPGVSTELDQCLSRLKENQVVVEKLQSEFSNLIGADNSFKLESSGKVDDKTFKFMATSRRGEVLKTHAQPVVITDNLSITPSTLKYTLTPSKKESQISSPELDQVLDDYRRLRVSFEKVQQRALNEYTARLLEAHLSDLKHINEFLTQCDVYSSIAMVAQQNAYHRPVIDVEATGPMFEDLRHPIVLQNSGSFISNDVDYTDGKPKLCFSLNSSGKSTLARSLMVALYCAQAGLFVASKMTFAPFRNLFTRIVGEDILQSGLSSFDRECVDLGYILKHMDERTFMVADEPARGSEQSAILCVNSALIDTVVKKKAKLFLTSHCHSLKRVDEIRNTSRFYVMQTEFQQDGSIVFHRKFVESIGDECYGLKCAASILGKDSEFMSLCGFYEKKYIENVADTENLVPSKRSRYNANVVVEHCMVCGKTSKDNVLETHHLCGQKMFDANKLCGDQKMNSLDNLVVLCSTCHDSVDMPGKLVIRGWQVTSEGRKLDYDLND